VLLAPAEGTYELEAVGERALELVLDDKPVPFAERPRGSPPARSSGPLRLAAGLHRLLAVTRSASGGLRWRPPGWTQSVEIGEEFFFHEVPEPGSLGPFARLVRGLRVECFADDGLRQRLAEYTVRSPSFDFGNSAPCTAAPKDGFSLRMSGYLLVTRPGPYEFQLETADVARLIVDGSIVVDAPARRRDKQVTAQAVELSSGYREIVVEFTDPSGTAALAVRWDPPDHWKGLSEIPPSHLFHRWTRCAPPDRKGLAPGLRGGLYQGREPQGKPFCERLDPAAAFAWGRNAPAPGLSPEGFSGSWSGVLSVARAGAYTFRARRQGGVVMTIGAQAVVNDWRATVGWEEATVQLPAGKLPFSLRYFNARGDPVLQVWWSGPDFGLRELGPDALGHQAASLAFAPAWEPETPPAAPPPPAAAGPQGPEPRTGETGQVGKAAERPPAGNLVKNGGFEELGEDHFARGWKVHQAGAAGAGGSARIDQGNSHGGDRALLVRSAPGGQIGAFTTLNLVPATYELRFWACADVGKTAQVCAHLAGRDLPAQQVGEDWRQIVFTVEITEKKLAASLRLWGSTGGVKIWFDDVELEAKAK